MKKFICFCMILFVILPAGCKSEQKSGPDDAVSIDGGDLLPANADSMTVSYNDYTGNATEPELKTYQADKQKFQQFCDFIKISKLLQLTDKDALSFSNIVYVNAADISVRFDTGEPLYIYVEGGISRFIDSEGTGLPKLECYSVSRDMIHQLQKILIPDFEKDYQALSMESGYVKSDDINPDNVKEIPLFIPQGRKIFTVSDGIIAFHSVFGGNESDSFLRAVKYDERGDFLWVQNYPDIKLSPYSFKECIQTGDGGFVFGVSGNLCFRATESEDKQETVITLGWLVKCDKSGDIIWKEQIEFRGGDEAEWICETESGDILTVGNCQTDDGEHYKSGDSTHGYTDLLLMKYDKTGKRTGFRKYGGSDFDSSRNAYYSPDVGLVVTGSTQSCDGDITQRKEKGTMLYPREFLAVFDDDLNEKWQYIFEEQEEIYTSYAAIYDKQIYVTGSLSKDTGKHNRTAVFKFNNDGTAVKSEAIDTATVMGICVSDDGVIMIPVNPSAYAGDSAAPRVYRLDTNLNNMTTVNDTSGNGNDYTVIPTDDNGFFTIHAQIVAYLPQPPWMNRSMTDSAVVLSRYNASGKLIYRKTYNKNHEVEDTDMVIPMSDGRVIVGR